MSASKEMKDKGRETMLAIWNKFCETVPQGAEYQGSSQKLAEDQGVKVHHTRIAIQMWKALGMVEQRSEYQFQNQTVWYKRVVSQEYGQAAINEHFDQDRGLNYYKDLLSGRGRRSKTVSAGNATINAAIEGATVEHPVLPARTVAVVGEEAESPLAQIQAVRRELGEPEAMLEAARQYIGRSRAIDAKLDELEALGIRIDRGKLGDAIEMEQDPVLDAVALLLPMFDRQTRTIERLTSTTEELRIEVRDLRRGLSPLEAEVRSLKDANRRLAERNAKLVVGGEGKAPVSANA